MKGSDTILDMIAAMKDTKKLNGKTFADYMNNLSTQLASDSSSNQTALKTGTTVLNSIHMNFLVVCSNVL